MFTVGEAVFAVRGATQNCYGAHKATANCKSKLTKKILFCSKYLNIPIKKKKKSTPPACVFNIVNLLKPLQPLLYFL